MSVTVAVNVIRLSGISPAASLVSGVEDVVWTTARAWSSVTSPLVALTLTVNTRSLLVAVRPSTWPELLTLSTTASLVAVSISPVVPALTPSV